MYPKFSSVLAAGLLAQSTAVFGVPQGFSKHRIGGGGGYGNVGVNPGEPSGSPGIKNFIYIVPDGYGQASQAMARDYTLLNNANSTIDAPIGIQYGADKMVVGTVRTLASDNLITDSAASGTAFACGVKSYNDAVGVNPDVEPVGSILETAKLAGFKTGLVVTSTINHATPAVYASHVEHRDSYEAIAAQEIGYSHPLGPMVDILMGGGRCYFKPQSDPESCRGDDLDLFGFAKEKGYHVMQDRAAFDELELGESDAAAIPYIGLFNDDQMMYEIDRMLVPEEEPSLLEMAKTALKSLNKAVEKSEKGYFIMIEASRIDHAGHANDAAAHLHETIMYNSVMDFVREWIDAHPDTMMMSAADHECGGLTLNGFNPLPLGNVKHSFEYLQDLWEENDGAEERVFLAETVLPAAGLTNVTDAEIDALLELGEDMWAELSDMQAELAGVNWSTGGHTGSDITLHGYGAGKKNDEFRAAMAGNWDNTELPLYIEKLFGLDIQSTTDKLRTNGVDWVPKADALKKRSIGHSHSHSHSHNH